MKRIAFTLLGVCLALGVWVWPCPAQTRVERQSSENPMVEVFRSTIYGGLAGLVVGSAIALVDESHSGNAVKWGFVGGTFLGLGYGLYYVSTRPQPRAMLEVGPGGLRVNAAPTVEWQDGARVYLLALRR